MDLDPGRIVDQPAEDAIRQLAGEVTSLGPPVQHLYWIIADRSFIYALAKDVAG